MYQHTSSVSTLRPHVDARHHPLLFYLTRKIIQIFVLHNLVGIGLSKDVLNSLVNTVDGIGILVGDLNAEFLLNGHNNLNGIQAVKSKVVCEVRRAVDLAGIGNLVKVLQKVDYPSLSFLLVKTGRSGVETNALEGKARSELSGRSAADLEGSRGPDGTRHGGPQRADNSGTEHYVG